MSDKHEISDHGRVVLPNYIRPWRSGITHQSDKLAYEGSSPSGRTKLGYDMKEVKLEDVFPYEYMGGGYFRERGIPQNEKAKIIHGMEAMKVLFEIMKKLNGVVDI